jgi:hypothetical protein
VEFLGKAPLRGSVADLELALAGCAVQNIPEIIASHGVTEELLRSAVVAREIFGKLSDLIHAAAIAQSIS